MKHDKVIIGGLLLLCMLLIIGIVGMGFLLTTTYKKQHDVATPLQTPIVQVKTEEDRLPIYPRQNPTYPLRRVATDYQQIGTLVYEHEAEPIILPLFGRPMPTRQDRWEYYTATDKQNMLRIPVMFENNDCTEEIGCREVYKNDKVFIPAYQKEFKVNLYKYKDNAYIPN